MESTSAQHKFDAPGARAGITVDLVALLSKLPPAQRGEGMTTTEIATAMGCGVDRVRRLLKQAIDDGKCRVGRKIVTNMAGLQQPTISYVLVQGDE